LVTREDGWIFFGFLTREERDMFRMLIHVSGVGPKLALGVLSGATPSEVALFLRTGDETSLAKLPGIGRKTAARLVVELGQRVAREWTPLPTPPAGASPTDRPDHPFGGAVAVLTALGLSVGQAERALQKAKEENLELAGDLQEWVRAALRTL
jgi:Holliday junction DNA helicase RuvA